MRYFYIDKEIADNKGLSEILGVFDEKILNPHDFFKREVYEVVDDNIPYYIIYDNGKIREATKYERYLKGNYILLDREVIYNGEIVFLDDGQYVENGELITIDCPTDGNMYDWKDKKWIFNLEKTIEKKENELLEIRTQMKNIIDEIEYSKNYGLYTTYSLNDLEELKNKELKLSMEIAMLINNQK